jgi:hypothetical protein
VEGDNRPGFVVFAWGLLAPPAHLRTFRLMDLALLDALPASDPYRRVLEAAFVPQTLSPDEYRSIRSTLVEVLLADLEHRPCTPGMRSARLGRFVPYLAWCLRQGYPMAAKTLLDPDLIETCIAQCPEVASTTDGVYQFRSALGPLCGYFGNMDAPAQKVQRRGTRSQPAVPLLAARRLLRVADSLRHAQARDDARAVLALAHGAGMETRHLVAVRDVDVTASDGGGVVVSQDGVALAVHESYGEVLLQVAGRAKGRILGERTRPVAGTVGRLNEALKTSGYGLVVDVAALRAGWLEWHRTAGMGSAESRDEGS